MSKFLLLFSLLFSSLSFAEKLEEFPFLGITGSLDSISLEDPYFTLDNEASFGLRYGKQSTDWRTMFTLQGNSDFSTIDIEMDKILMDSMFGFPEVRPYLGLSVGYLFDHDNNYEADGSVYYGGNFGFLFYLSDNIDLDLSYHYYDVPELPPINYMSGFNLGLHYFY